MYYATDLFIGRSMSAYGEWSEGELTAKKRSAQATVREVSAGVARFAGSGEPTAALRNKSARPTF